MKKICLIIFLIWGLYPFASLARVDTFVKPDYTEETPQERRIDAITPDLFPELSRGIHDFNMRVIYALEPGFEEYRSQKIASVHKGVFNFLRNLQEPLNATNALLQLDILATFKTTARFIINTTAGMFGFMDVAGHMGLKQDNRDFGQTLGVWGVPMMGFFVMPLIAQTSTRGLIGTFVDSAINPMNSLWGWVVSTFLTVNIQLMSVYENYSFIIATNETSLNSYETFKTMYIQHREAIVAEHCLLFCNNRVIKDENNNKNIKTEAKDKSYAYDFDMEL